MLTRAANVPGRSPSPRAEGNGEPLILRRTAGIPTRCDSVPEKEPCHTGSQDEERFGDVFRLHEKHKGR